MLLAEFWISANNFQQSAHHNTFWTLLSMNTSDVWKSEWNISGPAQRIFKFTSAAWHWGICPYSCAPVHVHVRDEGGLSTNSVDSFPYFEVQPDALCSWPPYSSSCPHRLFTTLTILMIMILRAAFPILSPSWCVPTIFPFKFSRVFASRDANLGRSKSRVQNMADIWGMLNDMA